MLPQVLLDRGLVPADVHRIHMGSPRGSALRVAAGQHARPVWAPPGHHATPGRPSRGRARLPGSSPEASRTPPRGLLETRVSVPTSECLHPTGPLPGSPRKRTAVWVVAVWCTHGALYTLPFRGRRQAFVSTMLLMWWDAARAGWLYWMGVLRLALVLVGWSAMFVSLGMKLTARGAVRLAVLPFAVSERVAKHYARPGVPWIAVLMFRFWCFVEAPVFTWVLFPTVSTVVAKFLGPAHARAYTAPVLYVFLLVLVRGSFASLRALADAVKTHERKWLAQIVVVGLSVMVFEVLVLYRELVHVLASWIAARTGGRYELGAWLTVAIPLAGWISVR